MDRTPMTHRPPGNLVFAVLFLLVCTLPLVGLVVPDLDRSGELNEKRELAVLPRGGAVPLAARPAAYEEWFNDHFGFRRLLVRLHGLFHYRVFNASGSPLVLPGRDRWLFYDGRGVRGGDPRQNHLARLPAGHRQMFADLKDQLVHNRDYFAARGITYVFVVVPDKWSVYAEKLPESVGAPPAETSADLFLAYLRAETDLIILDLKEPLRDLRWRDGPLYHQIDSHWNDLGAFQAAGAITRFLAGLDGRVRPLVTDGPELSWQTRRHGDLAALMGLEGWLRETEPRVAAAALPPLEITNLPKPRNVPNANRFPVNVRQEQPDLPRLLVLRDSYGDALLPWLSRGFSEARFVWTSNYRRLSLAAVLDEVGPDIVIEEKAEKYLMFPVRYYTAPGRSAVPARAHRRR